MNLEREEAFASNPLKWNSFKNEFEHQFGQWQEHISEAIQMHKRLTMKTIVYDKLIVLILEWKKFQRKLAFTRENFQGDYLSFALELYGYDVEVELIGNDLVPVIAERK